MAARRLSRRQFLRQAIPMGMGLSGAGLVGISRFCLSSLHGGQIPSDYRAQLVQDAPPAWYWIAADAGEDSCHHCHEPADFLSDANFLHATKTVKCLLCARECLIKEGHRGKCNTRINRDGRLYSLVYGRPVSVHVDPIEKKPLFHFMPGASALSLATAGCPLSCQFCQNWQISQAKPEDYPVAFTPPERIVQASQSRQAPVIAFTYNEPTVFTEYLTDIARLARQNHLRSVLISCGFMNPEPLTEMCEVLDAIKIDLKGFSEEFYRRACDAQLKPVLRSIKQISGSKVHLEIVNLVVPTLNDSPQMLGRLVEWIAGEIGPDVPVHFTRFHPDYRLLNLPPTPVATLEQARDMALAGGLRYVYVGNVPGHAGNHTYCPACGQVVIRRTGFFIQEINIINGKCAFCRQPIAGVWT